MTNTGIESGYTEEELYIMFCGFHDHKDALQLLADFIGYTNKEFARPLYERFKLRKRGLKV